MRAVFALILLFCVSAKATTLIIAEGDSLTAGYGLTPTGSNWVGQLINTYPATTWTNVANSGKRWEQAWNPHITNATTTNQLAAFATTTKRTVVVWCGINDIAGGNTLSATTNVMRGWIDAVRAFDSGVKLVGVTILKITGMTSPQETMRTNLNATIKSGWFDYYVDLDTVSELSDPSNLTYFQADGVHTTIAGNVKVAAAIASTLSANRRINDALYVTPSGAGTTDGSSWANAFAGFSDITWGTSGGQLGPGATLYIAGGAYTNSGDFELKGSGTSTASIQILRARSTNAECSSATGWSSSYDNQAVINVGTWGIWAETLTTTAGGGRYTVVDGITNDGIRLNLVQNALATGIRINAQGVFNSSFRNIGIYGPSTNAETGSFTWTNEVRGVYVSGYSNPEWTNGVSVYPSDITIDSCTVAGVVTAFQTAYSQRLIVQSNNVHTIESITGAPHGNMFYVSRGIDLTIRHNEWHDSMFGVGIFLTYLGDGGVRSSNIFIHGNIFRDSTQGADRAIEVRIETTNAGPFYIYNNTFVNMKQGININSPLNPLAQSYIRNNLFVGTASGEINLYGTEPSLTTNNNYSATSAGSTNFVSWGSTNILGGTASWQWVRNLRLTNGAAAINIGADLGATYNKDKDGNTFGGFGAWDVGAFEFQGGVASASRSPFSGHRVTFQGRGGIQ